MVVATSSISICVKDEPVVSSLDPCKFQDAAVQTDFNGEKLPDGFVPYTKHRFLALLLHLPFVYTTVAAFDTAAAESLVCTCAMSFSD